MSNGNPYFKPWTFDEIADAETILKICREVGLAYVSADRPIGLVALAMHARGTVELADYSGGYVVMLKREPK